MILCEKNLFTLHTKNSTYQMKAGDYGILLHTYYGPRISGGDLSYRIRRIDRGFSPNPGEAGESRVFSLDTIPQEYSACGMGDYRLPSLELELPSGSRSADLRYRCFRTERGKYALEGLPSFRGEEGETLVVVLEDAAAQVDVELWYGVLEDYDIITRAVKIVNRGQEPVKLRRAASLCLDFQRGDLDFITFDGRHAMERCPNRGPLLPGVRSVGSVRGASSHQHNPFVILCDNDTTEDHGLCYGAMLLYSGNFEAAAERAQFEDTRLVLGIHPYHFCFPLAPGESFTTPEAALCCAKEGLSALSHRLHRAIRERLIRDPWAGRRKPVLINNWEATEFSFDAERLVKIAEKAAAMGMEMFVMDDGWFGERNSDTAGLGDWTVNRDKLPGGLEALVPRIKALGMKFGIWIEPEMVSGDSRLYREHPDWAFALPGREPALSRNQYVLDITRREVRDYIMEQIFAVLHSANVEYVKWDMNRPLTDIASASLPADRQGEICHRYVLAVYEMQQRLVEEFPGLLLENCSGGGGRFDPGMLYYSPQIWCSDDADAIERLSIQESTAMLYPLSAIGAHISVCPNHTVGRVTPFETRGYVALAGTFGYELDITKLGAEDAATVKKQTAMYHRFNDLVREGDYYRIASYQENRMYDCFQVNSPDKGKALVFYTQVLNEPNRRSRILRLQGLLPDADYRVWQADMEGEELLKDTGRTVNGSVLMQGGFPFERLWGDFRCRLLYLERAGE